MQSYYSRVFRQRLAAARHKPPSRGLWRLDEKERTVRLRAEGRTSLEHHPRQLRRHRDRPAKTKVKIKAYTHI